MKRHGFLVTKKTNVGGWRGVAAVESIIIAFAFSFRRNCTDSVTIYHFRVLYFSSIYLVSRVSRDEQ